jgi:hypothetical protein
MDTNTMVAARSPWSYRLFVDDHRGWDNNNYNNYNNNDDDVNDFWWPTLLSELPFSSNVPSNPWEYSSYDVFPPEITSSETNTTNITSLMNDLTFRKGGGWSTSILHGIIANGSSDISIKSSSSLSSVGDKKEVPSTSDGLEDFASHFSYENVGQNEDDRCVTAANPPRDNGPCRGTDFFELVEDDDDEEYVCSIDCDMTIMTNITYGDLSTITGLSVDDFDDDDDDDDDDDMFPFVFIRDDEVEEVDDDNEESETKPVHIVMVPKNKNHCDEFVDDEEVSIPDFEYTKELKIAMALEDQVLTSFLVGYHDVETSKKVSSVW